MIVFQNDTYKVVANTDRAVYQVVNLATNFIEATEDALPKAMITADEYNRRVVALVNAQREQEAKRNGAIPFIVR